MPPLLRVNPAADAHVLLATRVSSPFIVILPSRWGASYRPRTAGGAPWSPPPGFVPPMPCVELRGRAPLTASDSHPCRTLVLRPRRILVGRPTTTTHAPHTSTTTQPPPSRGRRETHLHGLLLLLPQVEAAGIAAGDVLEAAVSVLTVCATSERGGGEIRERKKPRTSPPLWMSPGGGDGTWAGGHGTWSGCELGNWSGGAREPRPVTASRQ